VSVEAGGGGEIPVGEAHTLEVPRTARYLTLGPDGARDVWIVLHGYGQLARRFLRRFVPIDDGTRLVVAPEALSRFYVGNEPGRHGPASLVGATWMTREDREHEIQDYVRYLDLLADWVAPVGTRLTVLGFSQGVATAARWASLGRVCPDRIVFWGDFLPPDLDVPAARARWTGMELMRVWGDGDPGLRATKLARAEEEMVAALGLSVPTLRYDGGHDIDAGTLAALASGPSATG